MRISDWSSDVCSSDLFAFVEIAHQQVSLLEPLDAQRPHASLEFIPPDAVGPPLPFPRRALLLILVGLGETQHPVLVTVVLAPAAREDMVDLNGIGKQIHGRDAGGGIDATVVLLLPQFEVLQR